MKKVTAFIWVFAFALTLLAGCQPSRQTSGSGWPWTFSPAGTVTNTHPGTAAGTPAAASTPSPTSSAPALPDPASFFHNKLRHRDKSISGGLEIFFNFDRDSAGAAYEYARLLENGRFNLKLRETVPSVTAKIENTVYVFDYTGSAGVDPISKSLADTRYEAPVLVFIREWPEGWCYLYIYCSDGFSFTDNGDRSSDSVFEDLSDSDAVSGPIGSGSSGSSASSGSSGLFDSSDSSGSSTRWTFCTKCHGDGKIDCSQCNGKGGKYVYVSGGPNYGTGHSTSTQKWENCSKCHGSGEVTCTSCGGSGKTYY